MTTYSFAGSINLDQYIDNVFTSQLRGELSAFNKQLMQDYNPDIGGYVLCLMIPPPFLSLPKNGATIDLDYVSKVQRFSAFSAVEFTPPQIEIKESQISVRAGAIPYGAEHLVSNDCNVTFIDNYNLDMYNYFESWVSYIHELLEGNIEPYSIYLDPSNAEYKSMDYVGGFYIIKYDITAKAIKYIGKVFGTFPKGLPSKELIGSRASNEITTLPINFACSYFKESLTPGDKLYNEVSALVGIYG